MSTIVYWLGYQIAGVPVGAWLALAALAEIQDRLRTSRWKSNTVLQLFVNGTVGRLRERYLHAEAAAPILASDTSPTEPTRPPSDHGFVALPALLVLGALGLVLAFMLAGCAATSSDLRRACATEQNATVAAYRVGAAGYRLRIETAKSVDPAVGRRQLTEDTVTYDKFLASLGAATATAETQCSAADAIDAGQKKDVSTLISIVTAAGVRVAEAVSTIEAAFGGGGAP